MRERRERDARGAPAGRQNAPYQARLATTSAPASAEAAARAERLDEQGDGGGRKRDANHSELQGLQLHQEVPLVAAPIPESRFGRGMHRPAYALEPMWPCLDSPSAALKPAGLLCRNARCADRDGAPGGVRLRAAARRDR